MVALTGCVPLLSVMRRIMHASQSCSPGHLRRTGGAPERQTSARPSVPSDLPQLMPALDNELSSRQIHLDQAGYFVIHTEPATCEIVARYFTNTINEDGAF
jgi:hypothetical protein